MPPKTQPTMKPDPSVTENPPDDTVPQDVEQRGQFELEYVLMLYGGITSSYFDTPEEANDYGVATYGKNSWWCILPVLKRRLPKEDDND